MAYLYLLCEHQSRSERLMCVRVLRYVLDIWSAHLKKHPRARYVPLVIPIVVHHGEHGWKAPVRLRDLYDAPAEVVEDLLAFLPDFGFILDDLAPQSDDELRARALSALPRLVLWSFKNIRYGRDAIPALRKAIDLVAAAVLAPNGVAATSVIMQSRGHQRPGGAHPCVLRRECTSSRSRRGRHDRRRETPPRGPQGRQQEHWAGLSFSARENRPGSAREK